MPLPPRRVPIGNPADLIRRRPDVRASERALAAINSMIGISVAEMFPKVTLLGNIEYIAPTSKSFATPYSFAYNMGPTLQWNILDFG